MKRVFADTGYWIAILDPKDGLNSIAMETSARIGRCRIVTSELVLCELLNAFASRGPVLRGAVFDAVKSLRTAQDTEIVSMSSERFEAALSMYSNRCDKTWSLTDCSSFLIMNEQQIGEALAHDDDFEQAGYVALLRKT